MIQRYIQDIWNDMKEDSSGTWVKYNSFSTMFEKMKCCANCESYGWCHLHETQKCEKWKIRL